MNHFCLIIYLLFPPLYLFLFCQLLISLTYFGKKKSCQVSWHWEGSPGLLGRVLQWEGKEKGINAAQSYLEILVKMFPVVFLGRSWEFFLPFPHTFPFDTILPHWERKNIKKKKVYFLVSAKKPFIFFSPISDSLRRFWGASLPWESSDENVSCQCGCTFISS